ncbi:GNAT family N-acetyltransferase [Vibrio mytili]|uniref:Acetyltransferase n=1 Tax=Vibrio mytili TaxID=50718 RepID=A0A0C3I4N5_9VIBR|nr:GNAT family N-acetyltransferase [Vibrio mytili]KIN09307.1 acetyltransferase [Vibrio mytili]
MKTVIGNSPELIQKAQAIRHQVFTVEQNIPKELDLDGLDEESVHALVTENEALVATARLTITAENSSVMARVAVTKTYRGMGIASNVVRSLMEYARNHGISSIEIHAHGYLRDYYEQFGFVFIQDVEIVGEHQLIEMHYQFNHIT